MKSFKEIKSNYYFTLEDEKRLLSLKALKHEAVEQMYFLIALILTLGVVFWLVTKAEDKSQL